MMLTTPTGKTPEEVAEDSIARLLRPYLHRRVRPVNLVMSDLLHRIGETHHLLI